MKKCTKMITVKLTPEEYTILKEVAITEGRSMSSVIKMWIRSVKR